MTQSIQRAEKVMARINELASISEDATGITKAGAQYYSKDGISYQLVSPEPVYTKTVIYDTGDSTTFRRRERPFVYVDEKGKATAFFTACLTDKEQSWIEAQPVKDYVPASLGRKENHKTK